MLDFEHFKIRELTFLYQESVLCFVAFKVLGQARNKKEFPLNSVIIPRQKLSEVSLEGIVNSVNVKCRSIMPR